jgi:UDP-glucose 4-epimerase
VKRALVIGVGGFLGSHLARRLLTDGWQVVGLVRDPEALHVRARLHDVFGDLHLVVGSAVNEDLLAEHVKDADVVFPLAGHSGATRSLAEPVEDAIANAAGQLALLEALRHNNRDARTLFPGSRLQYGRVDVLPVPETHPQEPTSVYGLHKMVGERYHLMYHELYGLQTCSLRISNPYGPGQDRPDHAFGVVGTFMATAARSDTIRLYGGGHQLRDYIYVDDLIDLMLLAVCHPSATGRSFNASGPRAVPLREMATSVIDTLGRGGIADVAWPQADRAVETGDYVGDVAAARSELGWFPKTDLRDGLSVTWASFAPVLAAT